MYVIFVRWGIFDTFCLTKKGENVTIIRYEKWVFDARSVLCVLVKLIVDG